MLCLLVSCGSRDQDVLREILTKAEEESSNFLFMNETSGVLKFGEKYCLFNDSYAAYLAPCATGALRHYVTQRASMERKRPKRLTYLPQPAATTKTNIMKESANDYLTHTVQICHSTGSWKYGMITGLEISNAMFQLYVDLKQQKEEGRWAD